MTTDPVRVKHEYANCMLFLRRFMGGIRAVMETHQKTIAPSTTSDCRICKFYLQSELSKVPEKARTQACDRCASPTDRSCYLIPEHGYLCGRCWLAVRDIENEVKD